MLRIALTKGRIEQKAIALFEKSGYDCSPLHDKGRKLIFSLPEAGLEFVLAKAADVITYVEHGVCDAGVVGKDTIMENGRSFFEIMDLGFGHCRFCLCGLQGKSFYDGYRDKKIATKYPKVAKDYFDAKGINVETVKIEGSVELAPLLGLADGIVDIVETGSTLQENGLTVYETIAPISARLIVNVASMKLKKAEIDLLSSRLSKALED